jgi:hypothetical protein
MRLFQANFEEEQAWPACCLISKREQQILVFPMMILEYHRLLVSVLEGRVSEAKDE